MRSATILLLVAAALGLPRPSAAQSELAADYADAVAKLRSVGAALRAYADDHPTNAWPARLTNLVAMGYLDAGSLICTADTSNGTEGGMPDDEVWWDQFYELDEGGCSFRYDFSATNCSWRWASLGDGSVSLAEIDTDGNGTVSWGEAKQFQLQQGDPFHPSAYDPRIFPAVRCFWFAHGNSNVLGSQTVINLGADRSSVFASDAQWEFQANVSPDDTQELREIYPAEWAPPTIQWPLGQPLLFPLWPRGVDASNMTYRLVEPIGTGQTRVLGHLYDNILAWTPDDFSPATSYIRVEALRDGVPVTNKTYAIIIPGTDGDGMPNDWELANFGTLNRDGALDFDSDGATDLDECIAGTSPTNSVNCLRIAAWWAGSDTPGLVMQWTGVPGRTYRVLSSTNLATAWSASSPPIAGIGTQIVVTNPPAAQPIYYRVGVQLTSDCWR